MRHRRFCVTALGAMLQGSLVAARQVQRQLEADLQRREGELAAARTIQLGLLPHRFPAFPERGDIDIYARIEPAREIGGDLFDYFFIAADRLFFFIGDVSGKGPPAALFMVMTKEVVRDAEPSSVEINPENFLRRLKEQEDTPLPLNQLALWLSKDPLSQR